MIRSSMMLTALLQVGVWLLGLFIIVSVRSLG